MRLETLRELFPKLVMILPMAICRVALGGSPATIDAASCLQIHVKNGQQIANIFSRTTSFKMEGYDTFVKRVSGTALYVIESADPLECPAAFVPESMRQTGMRGAIYGARKEA
jgi:hypothetical protein